MARLDPFMSMFNLHVSNAGKRADREFIAQFGQQNFDEHIAPLHAAGIMSIFNREPDKFTAAYVALVTAYVNANRALRKELEAA